MPSQRGDDDGNCSRRNSQPRVVDAGSPLATVRDALTSPPTASHWHSDE
ncbi:MAG: hypothetical protein M3389_07995 [Actinomycetota bacterium]|nr:hypothetical protein [Actinomycetota bacterium]